MSEFRDIVIAGGGMVGVSLALQLAVVLPEETRICLVEGFPFPEPVSSGRPDYHPAFDARSTATAKLVLAIDPSRGDVLKRVTKDQQLPS